MNSLPTITDPRRVAIVEEREGMAGQEWLAWLMDSLGHPLDRCMRGYLSAGTALARDLVVWKPNVVVCMGDEVLRAFHPDPKAKTTAWRGSLWWDGLNLAGTRPCTSPSTSARSSPDGSSGVVTPVGGVPAPTLAGQHVATPTCTPTIGSHGQRPNDDAGTGGNTFKCLCTLHPGDPQLRLSEWSPLLKFDLRRALEEATTPVLVLPERHIEWRLTAHEIVERLEALRSFRTPIGHDTEGWLGTGLTDFSFATSPTEAFWVPLRHHDWSRWWDPEDEDLIMETAARVIADPLIPKVCHNAAHEMLTWEWCCGVRLQGLADDTMLMMQSLYCELERNLSTVSSLLTRQPYYGESVDQKTPLERATYNSLDSLLPLEVAINVRALPEWTPAIEGHYRHRLTLLPAAVQQMMRGIRFDLAARSSLVESLDRSILEAQGELDCLAGIQAPTLREVTEVVCAKRAWGKVASWEDVVPNANPSWRKRIGRSV